MQFSLQDDIKDFAIIAIIAIIAILAILAIIAILAVLAGCLLLIVYFKITVLN